MFSDTVSDGYCTALAASSRATGSEGSFEIADVASVRHRGPDASTDILDTVDAENLRKITVPHLLLAVAEVLSNLKE